MRCIRLGQSETERCRQTKVGGQDDSVRNDVETIGFSKMEDEDGESRLVIVSMGGIGIGVDKKR